MLLVPEDYSLLLESDLAHVGQPMVPVEISVLLGSDFANVGRPMEEFQSMSTGLVQPVYSMIQLYKAAWLVQPGLVQPVSDDAIDDAMAVLGYFRDSPCCARCRMRGWYRHRLEQAGLGMHWDIHMSLTFE